MPPGKPQRAFTIVTAEHASAAIPRELSNLGLSTEVLDSHVAWDPGALEVATHLAKVLGTPLFLGEYSRLVADLNRSPTSTEVVPVIAFGVPVPGNHGLDVAARAARIARYHEPYWTAVRAAIEARIDAAAAAAGAAAAAATPVLHLSIHSFTGELDGKRRDLDLGILYDPSRPIERSLAAALHPELAKRGFDTRHNEPYDGRSDALVTANRSRYAAAAYAGIELEISHNLLPRIDAVARAIELAISAVLAE